MEKSIETIWKEGFLSAGPVATPKINDLYNSKSIHAIDQYKRRFEKNIQLLFITSLVVLLGSFFIGMPFMGVPMFLMFNLMVIVDKILLSKQKQLVKGNNCHEYLSSLLEWMNLKTRWNINVARIMYPVMFLSVVIGQWFLIVDGVIVGDRLTEWLLEINPEMDLLFGLPMWVLISVFTIVSALIYFAEKLYKWDIDMAYGSLIRKLDKLKTDMDELRK